MLRAEAERKPVILTLGSQAIILDNHPRVTQTYEMNYGYVYIHDPDNKQEPVEMTIGNNHYILIASPDPKHTCHVKKLQLEKVIMPMWKWKEISECHTLIHKDMDITEVKERYTKWGCSPKCCFYPANWNKRLRDCLSDTTKVETIIKRMLNYTFEDPNKYVEMQWMTNLAPDGENHIWATNHIKCKFFEALPHLYTSYEYRQQLILNRDSIHLGDIYDSC